MVFRLDLGQICFNLVENVFATRQLALIAKSIAIYDILVPKAYDPSGLRQESRALGATILK